MSDLGNYEDWKSLEYAIAHIDEARAEAERKRQIEMAQIIRIAEMSRNMTPDELARYSMLPPVQGFWFGPFSVFGP